MTLSPENLPLSTNEGPGAAQPSSWLDPRFIIHMDTESKNTMVVDWREQYTSKIGTETVFFIQNRFVSEELKTTKVKKEFKALKATFTRYDLTFVFLNLLKDTHEILYFLERQLPLQLIHLNLQGVPGNGISHGIH